MTDDIYELVELAVRQGWHVDKTNKGHWRFRPLDPAMPIVFFSGTPSDWRAIRNFQTKLRRAGLQLRGLGNSGGLVRHLFGG